MEILNIGPLELILFLVIAFLLLGPKGMVLTAYKIGKWIREAVRSPVWREILRSAQDIRELPTKLMEETGLEESLKEIRAETQGTLNEVNSSLKEVKDATRVAEAEHLRLDDQRLTPVIAPAANAVPAARQTYPPPVYSQAMPADAFTSVPAADTGSNDSRAASVVVSTVDAQPIAQETPAPAVIDTAVTSAAAQAPEDPTPATPAAQPPAARRRPSANPRLRSLTQKQEPAPASGNNGAALPEETEEPPASSPG